MWSADREWPARTLDAEGASLLVRDSGGTGSCVMFLHGLGGHAMELWPVASRLLDEFRVVAFDQRGHGGSTAFPEDVSRAAFVNDVVAVLDALDVAPAILVGQSMGAHTALLVAATRPDHVRGLVLVEGGVGGGGSQVSSEVIDWFRSWPVPFPDRAAAVQYFGGGLAGEGWAAGLEHTAAGFVPRFNCDVLHRAILAVHTQARWSEWESVCQPVLLVRGENGYLSQDEATRMLATNDRAQLVDIEQAGHDVHLDADNRLADEIRRFIGERTRAS